MWWMLVEHAMKEADFSGFLGRCTEVVSKGHDGSNGRSRLNVVQKNAWIETQ